MPTISTFYGIIIRMFYNDHHPPHFHAVYGEHAAKIDIETFEVVAGNLPRRALGLVQDWGKMHKNELRKNWARCVEHKSPDKIEPLD